MKYIPQIYQLKDRLGNTRNVEVSFDKDSKTYVASICGGRFHRMFDGSERQAIVALGASSTPLEAAEKAIEKFNNNRKER